MGRRKQNNSIIKAIQINEWCNKVVSSASFGFVGSNVISPEFPVDENKKIIPSLVQSSSAALHKSLSEDTISPSLLFPLSPL